LFTIPHSSANVEARSSNLVDRHGREPHPVLPRRPRKEFASHPGRLFIIERVDESRDLAAPALTSMAGPFPLRLFVPLPYLN